MVARWMGWSIGVLVGYWLVGIVGMILFAVDSRRAIVNALWFMLFSFLWLPLLAQEWIERSSARIKVDFDEGSK